MDHVTGVSFVVIVLPIIIQAQVYTFEPKTELNNILIHENDVYVGAVNYIHRLNSNLAEIKSEVTGPVNDSRSCISRENCPDAAPTNNRNTLLVVYKEESQLITCGSVFQGLCQVRNLSTLGVKLEGSRYVAANDANSSTVGFISASKLHVAVTLKDRFESATFPAVSIRLLVNNFDNLRDAKRKFLQIYSECKLEVKRNYVIDYISGFQLNEYAYFTSVQPVTKDSNSYHSKMIRYCINEYNFYPYTEIPLSCKDSSGTDYNILIAGMLLKATGQSAAIFNVSSGENVYIGVFSKSLPNSKVQTENNAVCVFSMSAIEKAFVDNIRQCIVHGLPKDGGLPWLKNHNDDDTKCRVILFFMIIYCPW